MNVVYIQSNQNYCSDKYTHLLQMIENMNELTKNALLLDLLQMKARLKGVTVEYLIKEKEDAVSEFKSSVQLHG